MPRQVLPGETHFLTKGCLEQRMFLLPAKWLNEVLCYCVGYACLQTGVRVHGLCFMSNHWHIILSDPEGRFPKFMQLVHLFVAKCVNAEMGRSEGVWTRKPYNDVVLFAKEDVVGKLAYTLTNPCAAGLVARAKQWPGFHTAGVPFGTVIEAERPKVLFREDGSMPERVSFRLTRPPQLQGLSNAKATEVVAEAVREREKELEAARVAARRKWLGRRRCLNGVRGSPPRKRHPIGELSPRVAARDAELRKALLTRYKAFLEEYRDAYLRWRAGEWDVEFPAGTYALRWFAGVQVAGVGCWDPGG